MNKFIERLDYSVDLETVKNELQEILYKQYWPEGPLGSGVIRNQLSLKHKKGATGNLWFDGIGSLKDDLGNIVSSESDFTEWNPETPPYTKSILEELSKRENVKFGRIRFMRLLSKTGLTIHTDPEIRYHLVIKTNPFALFGHAYTGSEEIAKCYNVPADSYFYKVDTRLGHFVFNGGKDDRIHLVICPIADGSTLKNN